MKVEDTFAPSSLASCTFPEDQRQSGIWIVHTGPCTAAALSTAAVIIQQHQRAMVTSPRHTDLGLGSCLPTCFRDTFCPSKTSMIPSWELPVGSNRSLVNGNGSQLAPATPQGEVRPGLTCSGHGRWGGCAQVADLKQQSHGWVQGDSLIACQGQHLHMAHKQSSSTILGLMHPQEQD